MNDQSLQKIVTYWNQRKRRRLSEAEWTDFYHLVAAKLMSTRLPSEYNDLSARWDLINSFFAEKVLLNAHSTTAGDLDSANVLHLYLKRFALDQLTDMARIGLVEVGENGIVIEGDEEMGEMCATELSHDERQLLEEAGIDLESAWRTAEVLVGNLGEGEKLMLRDHTCADKDEQVPMVELAKRRQIASYHYKAKKLGITGEKGGFFVGYEHTTIGSWFKKLGAEISPDWQHELVALLNLLCLQVRQMARGG